MNISQETRQSHERLSRTSAAFLQFAETNNKALERANFTDIKVPDRPDLLQPWPTFINQHTRDEIEEAGLKVYNLIKSLPKRIFNNDPVAVARFFDWTPEQAEYCLYGVSEEQLGRLFGRGDFVFAGKGLKCVEYNIASNLGGWQVPFYNDMYLRNPVISEFVKSRNIKVNPKSNLVGALFDFLIANELTKFGPDTKEINVCIAFDRKPGQILSYMELNYLRKMYKAVLYSKYQKEGDIVVCHIVDLKTKGNHFTFQGKKLRTVIEYTGGNLAISILNVLQEGEVLMYNGNITLLITNKLNFALLSEYRDSDYFTPVEREIIREFIPWARKIGECETDFNGDKINLPNFIRTSRERLVIKPPDGLGGKGVCIGKYTPSGKWEETLTIALRKGNWLVQEYVEPMPLFYQDGEKGGEICDTVTGFFTFGERYAGGFVRVLPRKTQSGVVNTKQGAKLSTLIEVIE